MTSRDLCRAAHPREEVGRPDLREVLARPLGTTEDAQARHVAAQGGLLLAALCVLQVERCGFSERESCAVEVAKDLGQNFADVHPTLEQPPRRQRASSWRRSWSDPLTA